MYDKIAISAPGRQSDNIAALPTQSTDTSQWARLGGNEIVPVLLLKHSFHAELSRPADTEEKGAQDSIRFDLQSS